MNPCKGDTATFVDNKDNLGDQHYEGQFWFLFTYIILIQIESALYLAQTYFQIKAT